MPTNEGDISCSPLVSLEGNLGSPAVEKASPSPYHVVAVLLPMSSVPNGVGTHPEVLRRFPFEMTFFFFFTNLNCFVLMLP